jgi:hypothetical protein
MPPAPSNANTRPLTERLAAYGCTDFIRLDESFASSAQIEYLDLLPRRNVPAQVTAVVEHQGTALLYLIDSCGDVQTDSATIVRLQQQLANRSDPAWLGVVRPGSLEIHPIGFHETASTAPIETIAERDERAPLFFQSLVHGTFTENRRLKGSDYVFKEIFGLLTQTTNAFVPENGKGRLDALDVLSMAGRALFFRFLIDRKIILDDERTEICPAATTDLKDCFSTAEKAAQTSAWLDETFNGDFLQLINESIPADNRRAREKAYLTFYQKVQRLVGRDIFNHLQAILRGWHAVGGNFQPELDWNNLDFAHIPVGVLSQVYESFSHRADPRTARETSVHYTPRSIAKLMVDQVFAATKHPAAAKVLDSSSGAGIFLVLAFRRLVRERWQHDEQRPDTRTIQKILYEQLTGFDVSESALRLAALSLYITAIEVNGTQRPPKALKFPKNLRNTVLHHFGDAPTDAENTPGFVIGSLGPNVPPIFNNCFDIVIGNPPWTRLREEELQNTEEKAAKHSSKKTGTDVLNDAFTEIGCRVLRARGLDELADIYENPDKNPDLPFVWRAMEWAKQDDGLIALAMPARIFGRTSGKGYEAWRAILRSISITGIINGADLRKTGVWEGVDMPFSLLFAKNIKSATNHRFYYSTPSYEPSLNRYGRFRLDYEVTQPIGIERVARQPWLLKTLSLGTWLDVEVMEKLTKAFPNTLADVWKAWNPNRSQTGQGYNLSENLEQMPAKFLAKLKDFHPPSDGFSIQFDELNTFKKNHGKETVYWTKGEELYQPPLVIVPRAPSGELSQPKAYISPQALAFSQSYYGYSCKGHPESEVLASLIYLISHSDLFRYYSLMVSVTQGADHMMFTKQDFDTLPFPDVATIDKTMKEAVCKLAHRLEHDSKKPFHEINSVLFRLYGLDDDAVQIARDTLFAAASYRKAGRAALEQTIHNTRVNFINTLTELLEPYFDVCGEHVVVVEPNLQPDTWGGPWFFLTISRAGETVPINSNLLCKAMEEANKRAASRIIVKAHGRHGLLLGLLNQRRWWTVSRARLCGQHILRNHLNAFGFPENV